MDSYYFYILVCADAKRYYGSTVNLAYRLRNHNEGLTPSTKWRRPVKLVCYKEFKTRSEAVRYERKFKSGKTRKTTIDKLIKEFPQDKLNKFMI